MTVLAHTDEMLLQLDGCMERFSTHVADVMFGSVWVMTEPVMFIKQLLTTCCVVAQRTLVHVGIVAVIFSVHHCHVIHKQNNRLLALMF